MEYAIVDIETTGGYASANGITEISIHVFDGQQTIDHFETLINPGSSIPGYISAFTGISNEMVEDAPSFPQIAKRVYELLEGRVFVAHSVNFDYSFIKNALAESGFDLNVKKLCTVRLSRKIFPGLTSYSLGNICSYIGIPIQNRHRAGGDAEATVKLFHLLLDNDHDNHIHISLKRTSKEQVLPPNLPKAQFDALPLTSGIYYFHDKQGKVIYVGKAKRIKTRVSSHFSNNSTAKQKQDFIRNIHSISYEEWPTELMALIKESHEIKHHWPAYNRAQKKFDPAFGIYDYEDQKGFIRLGIDRIRKHTQPLLSFSNQTLALATMNKIVETFELCPVLCCLHSPKQSDHPVAAHSCPVCAGKERAKTYNKKVNKAISYLETKETFIVLDKGLNEDEISCIAVDNGKFIGMGLLPSGINCHSIEEVRDYIKPMRENFYIRQMIYSYAERNPSQVRMFM